jgi:hypothetical protein
MIMTAIDIVRRKGNELDDRTIRQELDGNPRWRSEGLCLRLGGVSLDQFARLTARQRGSGTWT